MTEPVESGQVVDGVQQTPNAATSPPSVDQPISPSNVDELAASLAENPALMEALLGSEKFNTLLDKRVQSVKDRRIDKLSRTIAEQLVRDESGEVEPTGQTPATDPTPEGNRTPDTQATYVDYVTVIQAMGLDPASADVTQIIREGGSYQDQIGKFAALKTPADQTPQTTNVPAGGGDSTPSAPMPTGTGGSVQTENLPAEYQAELKLIRQGDVTAITALKKKYRDKGLMVH